LQLVRFKLQLVRQVAIGLAVKLQSQGLCICYIECTWVHFSIACGLWAAGSSSACVAPFESVSRRLLNLDLLQDGYVLPEGVEGDEAELEAI
jgi:hypothetical protein